MNRISIFSPATIANVSCGFDVLGLCLDSVGDEMTINTACPKGVKIKEIIGADLPLVAEKNVGGVAALALLEHLQPDHGFEISIKKNIKAGSGIGSSAASAAGAVFAINHLLGSPLSNKELVPFAMQGEKLASGSAHADNVAPALLGGFTLIRSYEPLDIIKIDAPEELYATVIHPQIELKTMDARSVIRENITLKKATVQCGNIAGLISGLYTNDYNLIGRSLHDELVEPVRYILIPKFKEIKVAAMSAGALGGGISGSGPSVFALSRGVQTAQKAAEAMASVLQDTGIPFELHVSPINPTGIKIL
ncbi:homoserine kinase [Flavobacterium album]|uniref:Homoserine kinase n=1 Tax=Flavobacterium album TaxID=2175091 RepID=A0A2S1QYI8_9FLAO|nr:homoserine kinase [Flavobacterium album]AWH85458.1 homoserine kinase [Flavobacterium album]